MAERFYKLLYWQIAGQMPRPGGAHRYSKGGLIAGYKALSGALADGTGFQMVFGGQTAPYGRYAMGYKDDGTKRTPRGELEKINFRTIDNCMRSVSKVFKNFEGGVYLDGNQLY